jgi:hypothetical protein
VRNEELLHLTHELLNKRTLISEVEATAAGRVAER